MGFCSVKLCSVIGVLRALGDRAFLIQRLDKGGEYCV